MVQALIIVEHDGQQLKRSSLCAVALARQLGVSYALVVLGAGVSEIAESLRRFGAASVLVGDHPLLREPLADRYAALIVQTASKLGANAVLGTSSTFTKDILPRVAALLDAPMLTDVTSAETKDEVTTYQRPANAGSLLITVALEGERVVLTARGTAFQPPSPNGVPSPVEPIEFDAEALPKGMNFVSRVQTASTRPDLGEARVVVSGGRPLRDKETFDRLIGGLADALGGAVGATRAAVDAGMVPNDCQVGQTGKVVAPELYIGIGVSGAIQHLAGIKDSRVIVAINRDPDAPIFQMANYGLVGDLHEIVPHLIAALRT